MQGILIACGTFLFRCSLPLYLLAYRIYKAVTEQAERAYIKANIRSGSVICDIGANVGVYSEFLSRLAGPTGVVYAFEPEPQNFSILKKRTMHLSNVRAHAVAVGRVNGRASLFTSKTLCVDHRMYPDEPSRSRVEVECVSLDSFLPTGLKVDFVKMDIQGFEYEAILGMQGIMARNPGIKLVSEFWPYGLKKAGSSAAELIRLLHDIGFRVMVVTQRGLSPVDEYTGQWNEANNKAYFTVAIERE